MALTGKNIKIHWFIRYLIVDVNEISSILIKIGDFMKENIVPDYFFTQSGVVPYLIKGGDVKVLIITSRSGKKWILPKGVVEPYMTPAESAGQEAYEEAGVFGEVDDVPLGSYQVEKWGGVCTVTLYPMKVTKIYENWTEDNIRKRKWVNIGKAVKKIKPQAAADLVRELMKKLGEGAHV